MGIIEANEIKNLTRNNKTPFYLYKKSQILDNIKEIKSAFDFEGFYLLFATMANDDPRLLSVILNENVGACVNSIKHLELVLEIGFKKENIQFTSTGISAEEMLNIYQKGITMNLDSINQIETLSSFRNGIKMGLRINSHSLLNSMDISGDRIGIEYKNLAYAINTANNNYCEINGIHIYTGTNYQSHTEMIPMLRQFFKIAENVPDLEYVNIGGGIGVNYFHNNNNFDILKFGKEVYSLFNNLRNNSGKNIKLYFEPGRRLVADSGVFISKVSDIKLLMGNKYVSVDSSVSIFPRPFHNPETPHKVCKLGIETDVSCEKVYIVGHTTFSKDVLANCYLPEDISIGDYLIFEDAGAYCESMISQFLGQFKPKSLII